MALSAEQVAPHAARFLDTLDDAFRAYGVSDGLPPPLRDAVASTPRHQFVHRFRIGDGPLRDADADPFQSLPDIYSDAVMRHVDAAGELLPSSNSQPSYILFLLHRLALQRGQAVLEIGSGSGWLAAVMASLVGRTGRVVGVELIADLAAQSRADLKAPGLDNVEIITGDGTHGHAAGAPYERVMVTAATWNVPGALMDQMTQDGRALVPVELRSNDGCDVTVLRRQGAALIAEHSVPGWFVPLRGRRQDRQAAPIPKSLGEAPTRYSLPLGFTGDGGGAPAARAFRAFLGRTEPGFVSDTNAQWRPGLWISPLAMPLSLFGLAEADGSWAIWQAGNIISYGSGKAASRLATAYARCAALGLPGPDAFQLEVHKTGAGPPVSEWLSVEQRGDTVLAWRIKPTTGTWRRLISEAGTGFGPGW